MLQLLFSVDTRGGDAFDHMYRNLGKNVDRPISFIAANSTYFCHIHLI